MPTSSNQAILNINDLNKLLLEPTSSSTPARHIMNSQFGYDNLSFWDFDAAALSLGETGKQQPLPNDDSLFAALMGDITPAAASAVVGESPMMNTPALDSSYNTPFTPFTPATNFGDYQNSPFYSPFIDVVNDAGVNDNDLFGEPNFLMPSAEQLVQSSPIPQFTGDPSQLVLQNNGATISNVNEDASLPFFESFDDIAQDKAIVDVLPTMENEDSAATDVADLFGHCFPESFDDIDSALQPSQQQQQQQQQQQSWEPSTLQAETLLPIAGVKRSATDDSQVVETIGTKRIKRSNKALVDNENKRFQCPVCLNRFSRRYNLGTHIKTHDRNRMKQYACHICSKSFDRKHDCERHISTVHHGERLFACEECTSSFSRKDALTRHMIQRHHYTEDNV